MTDEAGRTNREVDWERIGQFLLSWCRCQGYNIESSDFGAGPRRRRDLGRGISRTVREEMLMKFKTHYAVAVMLATMFAAAIGNADDKKDADDYDAKVAANRVKVWPVRPSV